MHHVIVPGSDGDCGIIVHQGRVAPGHGNLFAKAGKGLDEKLKESIMALDEAKARVQSAFDHIRNIKS